MGRLQGGNCRVEGQDYIETIGKALDCSFLWLYSVYPAGGGRHFFLNGNIFDEHVIILQNKYKR